MHSALQWRHNGRDSVSNHQPHHCLLNGLFRRRSKKTSKLRVIGLCARNSPVTGEFPAQMASNVENVFIWWRHHGMFMSCRIHGWLSCQTCHLPIQTSLSFFSVCFLCLCLFSYQINIHHVQVQGQGGNSFNDHQNASEYLMKNVGVLIAIPIC